MSEVEPQLPQQPESLPTKLFTEAPIIVGHKADDLRIRLDAELDRRRKDVASEREHVGQLGVGIDEEREKTIGLLKGMHREGVEDGDLGKTLILVSKEGDGVSTDVALLARDTLTKIEGGVGVRSLPSALEGLIPAAEKIGDEFAQVEGGADLDQSASDIVNNYEGVVVSIKSRLVEKSAKAWSFILNKYRDLVSVAETPQKEPTKYNEKDNVNVPDPETFADRIMSTFEVGKRYRRAFNRLHEYVMIGGYQVENATGEMKKRLAKESMFLLSLRNPLKSINQLQDLFFAQRKGAPDRGPEAAPIAEKDKVLAYSESASFFKYGELGNKYSEAIEKRNGVRKSEQVAYAIRGMLEIAASDKKDKYHILPIKRLLDRFGPNKNGRDVVFVIYHKDAPYKLSIPIEKGGNIPSVDAIKKAIAFVDTDEEPTHKISRNGKIKLRRFAYGKDKKQGGIVNELAKADFAIVLDDSQDQDPAARRRRVNAADSLALTFGRETKATLVLQFAQRDGGAVVASGFDMKFSHPWFNGKDAAEMQFDLAMRMNAHALGRPNNNVGSGAEIAANKVELPNVGMSMEEKEYWNNNGENIVGLNREAINWDVVEADEIAEFNRRIAGLKKTGVPMTFGVLAAFGQAIGLGTDSFHQTYHCNRTDELDIATGVVPGGIAALFDQYREANGKIPQNDPSTVELRDKLKKILGVFDQDRKDALDNRSLASTMAATAGVFEGVLKPLAELLTGVMKTWVSNPGTMNSMLLSGYDKNNPDRDTGESARREGVGNLDTYKRLDFVGHTTEYMKPQGFDTAQTASYMHQKGRGVMGGGEVYGGNVTENSGVEARGVMLSMRLDLEQCYMDVAADINANNRVGVDDSVAKERKTKLENGLLELVDVFNDMKADSLAVDKKVKEIAGQVGTSPEDLVRNIESSMQKISLDRIRRTRVAMKFVLDLLGA